MSYTANRLLNKVTDTLRVKNDCQLSIELNLDPSTISNIRKGRTALTHRHLLNMHVATKVDIQTLRVWAGDTRTGHFTSPLLTQEGFIWPKE